MQQAFCRYLTLLVLVFLGSASALRAQPQTYTPAQIERLAKLSELYGHIKFFHPYLGYRALNWDSAYAQQAPAIARATTDAEAADALRRLLGVLRDEATTVRLAAPKTALAKPAAADSMQVSWGPDSTLILKTNAYAGAADYDAPLEKLSLFISRLPKARAVLLDLRSPRALSEETLAGFNYALLYMRFVRYLSAQPYSTLAMRLRSHSGFVPESGSSSGGYQSMFYIKTGELVPPYRGARSRPLAILVNKNGALPASLYALRSLPHVRLLSTDVLGDAALAETVKFPLSEAITVEFRTGEVLNADGSLGINGIDLIPPTTRPEAVQAYALAQLRAARPAAKAAQPAPPLVNPAPATYPRSSGYPALGYRLLAGAKMWSVIHYFHAYQELMPDSWDAALRPALSELAAASDSTGYALAVAHFYRHIQDGHGAINAAALRHYAGAGGTMVDIQFINNKPVIIKLYGDSLQAKGLRVGDVITAVNGEPVAARVARMAAIQPASNEWTRLSYVSRRLLRSPVGTPIRIELLGADNKPKTVTLISQPGSRLQPSPDTTRAYRVLPGNLGYADLSRLQTKDVDRMFTVLGQTKAIIFDMRGYPNGTAWAIAPRLTDRRQPVAAKFFRYAPNEPSAASGEASTSTQKYFFDQRLPPNEGKSVYHGKTVMLINETTQSQAEHTGLFFEAANGTEFIGSPTAGANGDVTYFGIPGGISLAFSGHDVRHADGRQLQQVGLQPKIAIRPTLKGIQKGQDEVLTRAISYLNTGK
jgi:C-terminal processing protease CtpA/Prc